MTNRTPSDAALLEATGLYEKGLYVQSARVLGEFGLAGGWQTAEARVFGSRLAQNLGAERLSDMLVTRAFRQAPHSPEAVYFYAQHAFQRRGPWAAWQILREVDLWADDAMKAEGLALRGRICAYFRDRAGFEQAFAVARELAPQNAYVLSELATSLEFFDETEQAREVLSQAFDLRPWYRPVVQQQLHALLSANEDEAAEKLFTEATQRLESGAIYQQWIIMKSEREEFSAIPALCERAKELLLWAEKPLLGWLDLRRAQALWHAGESDAAVAVMADLGLADSWRDRLTAAGSSRRRRILHVPFVRQDDATCAPASLASVAAFWRWDITHDEIAESVCYGGTYAHGLRAWVEDKGWTVREFRVTQEAARRVIDAGYPFLLATVDIGMGHMQVVEGYDEDWEQLLIRDPNFRHHRQVDTEGFLGRYAAFGPRGMLMVPPGEAEKVAGLDLPDTAGFDAVYRLSLALEKHRRDEAAAELAALENEAPYLRGFARLSLADYDADPAAKLQCLDELEAAGLKHPLLEEMRLETGRNFLKVDRIAALRSLSSWHREGDNALFDVSFLLRLAGELSDDERNFSEVRRIFARYHALQSRDAAALSFWGRELWGRQQRGEALELIKFAATCADKSEKAALDYFHAARITGGEEPALAFLRERVATQGAKSSAPAQSLYFALRALNRETEAFDVLVAAMNQRPEDGGMQLFSAYEYAAAGLGEEARRLLEGARLSTKRTAWLRTAAALAELDGDLPALEEHWAEVARLEPFALDALDELARRAEARSGPAAVVALWEEKCARFPFHLGFAQRRAEAARTLGDEYAEPFIRAWLDLAPASVDPRLVLIHALSGLGRNAEALAEAQTACTYAPYQAVCRFWVGETQRALGANEEARRAYEEAVNLDENHDGAMRRLWHLADGREAHDAVLQFIERVVFAHVSAENTLYFWYEIASTHETHGELEAKLEMLAAQRPAVWAVWNLLIRNLLRVGKIEEAVQRTKEATERFSLLSGPWSTAATVYEQAGLWEDSLNALVRITELAPGYPDAWIRAAMLLERIDRAVEGRERLEEAVRRNPLLGSLRATYAGFLWREGRKEEAISTIQGALWLAPEMEWAWEQFTVWCTEVRRPGHVREFSASLLADRPGQLSIALAHVQALRAAGLDVEAEAACHRMIEQQPLLLDAHLLLVLLLNNQGRLDEAVALVDDPRWKGLPPVPLLGQVAFTEHIRGRVDQAIARLRTAVERDPSYAWGWERLCEWQAVQGKFKEALPAAVRAAELQPDRGEPWRQLALIQLELRQEDEAMQTFREAVVREPGDPASLLLLIEKYLVRGKRIGAAAAWKSWGGNVVSPFREVAEILLHASDNQRAESRALLERLFASPKVTMPILNFLRRVLTDLKKDVLFDEALNAAIWRADIQPAAAICWVDYKLSHNVWKIGDSLLSLSEQTGARKAALEHYLLKTLDHGQSLLCRVLYQSHREVFHRDDGLWALLGLNLVCFMEANDWTQDWASRPNAAPWMLRGAAIAALAAGQKEEAFVISRTVLDRQVLDDSIPFHQIVVALASYFAGNLLEAKKFVDLAERHPLHRWDNSLAQVVRSLIESSPGREPNAQSLQWDVRMRFTARDLPEDPIISRIMNNLWGAVGKRGGASLRASRPGREKETGFQPKFRIGEEYELTPDDLPPPHPDVHRPAPWFQYSVMVLALSLLLLVLCPVFVGMLGDTYESEIVGFGLLFLAAVAGLGGSLLAGLSLRRQVHLRAWAVLAGNLLAPLAFISLIVIASRIQATSATTTPTTTALRDRADISPPLPKETSPDAELLPDPAPTPVLSLTPAAAPVSPAMAIPEDDAEAYERARALNVTGKTTEAIPLLEEILRKNPNNVPALVELADALRSLNKFDEALVFAQRAVDLAPADPSPLTVRASVLGMLKRHDEGEADLREAIRLQPDFYSAWLYLCITQTNMQRWPEVAATAEKCISLRPDDWETWSRLAYSFRVRQEWIDGENTLKRLLEKYPNSACGWYELGGLQHDTGMATAAQRSLLKAVEVRPSYGQAWNSLGIIQAQNGDRAAAIESFEKSIALGPRDPMPLNSLGFTLLQSGQTAEAAALFEKALALDPAHELALVNLINAYLGLNRAADANRVCDALSAVNPPLAEQQRGRIKSAMP